MLNKESSRNLIQIKAKQLKLKLSIYLLLIFNFWNIIYNMTLILSSSFAKVHEPNEYFLPLISMVFISIASFLAYSFYKKRQKLTHLFHLGVSEESMIANFYVIIIVFLSFFPKNYADYESNNEDYLLNFITLLIFNNILFILVKNQKLKVFMVAFFTVIWTFQFLLSNPLQNQLEITKLVIKAFTNLSLIIFFLYFEKSSEKIKYKMKKIIDGRKEKRKASLSNNKVLYKFLNSLNSGILLYDKNMELIFFNRKMKRFFHSNIDNKSKLINSAEYHNYEEEENAKNSVRQNLFQLRNIKCFIPDEKEMKKNITDASSSLKSLFYSMTNHSHSSTLQRDLNSGLSFKALTKIIKEICKDKNHPLHTTLKEHHLLFHYIMNTNSKFEIVQDSDIKSQSFYQNPQKRYNEIRISCIEYQETCLILMEFTNETDRKRSNELNILNEHKNKILAHVAHEFRTPLNSIIGNLELVQDLQIVPLEIKEDHLKPALFSSTLLLNYVNDILDFAQMKSEKLKMNYIKFNLMNHITTVSRIMEVLACKKSVNFEKIIDKDIPPIITSDPNRLTQILLNLLSNAFKFTLPEGQVLLKINFNTEDKTIRFEIADNGIGISDENLKKLFKEFGKIDSDENTIMNPSGVGLGLIISQKFAEEMGPLKRKGFEVQSQIGKGTSFIFYLEDKDLQYNDSYDSRQIIRRLSSNILNESKESEELNDKNRNLEEFNQKQWMIKLGKAETQQNIDVENLPNLNEKYISGSLKKTICFPFSRCQCPKILVVDDDLFNLSYLQKLLKILGYSTEFAVNGQDAINKIKKRLEVKCYEECKIFKLIFMDWEMPVLNGLEAAARIKSMNSINEKIAIVGCTGNTELNDLNEFKRAGADMVCSKPITKSKIISILETYKNLLNS